MNNKYFRVYLKDGSYYTYKFKDYGWKIEREEKLLYVYEYASVILRISTVLVLNMEEFSHIRIFEGDIKI